MKYNIYWYYVPKEHTDPYMHGYIGVTNNLERRHREHVNASQDLTNTVHLYNAIRKYTWENIERQVLHTVDTYAEASELEYLYRTETNIGWNSAIGGYLNIGEYCKVPIKLYHNSNPTNILEYSSIAEAADRLNISRPRLSAAKCRERSVYGFDGYAILFDDNFDVNLTKTVSELVSEGLTGLRRTNPSHFKGNTNRWSEEEKSRIGNQHKGKVISEKAKQSSRLKNRATNPSCKSITLVHKDKPLQEFVYHSISEASRQLQIPSPRLKSKVRATLGVYGRDGWAVISLGSE